MAANKKKNTAPPPESALDESTTGSAATRPETTVGASGAPSGKARDARFRVVGVGASAGGLEALTSFFHAMRADSGMAFVVVSHLDPEHKSALGEILSRITAMPVSEVEDGMAVVPDHVYVMPPNRDMTIMGGALRLTARAEIRAPHMPIDSFLCSLANDCGDYAVGVILSGTGRDGTLGLKAIKEGGGLTFAQDQTARYVGMPRSAAAAGGVDSVLPPAEIAAELLQISHVAHESHTQGPSPPEGSPEDQTFLEILQILSDRTGVDFVHYKHSTLLRRIERRMALQRLTTLNEYLERLRADAAELQQLFEEVLIQVTGFFRDPDSFDALKTTVLPRLMAGRPPKASFRVWVPGCSTGEEAYSIAICLLEYLGDRADAWNIKIFATDISDHAVETARTGAYGEGIAAEVSPQRLQRFFVKTELGYEISKTVRDLCVFARQDVTRDPPFSQLDLISCRNVLIYLGPELQNRVLPILHCALKAGGILMLGRSETVGGFTELFEVLDKKLKFYVRTSSPSRLTFDYTSATVARGPAAYEQGAERGRGPADVFRDADRVVLARYGPSGVVVNDRLQIVQFRGDTGPYLKPPPGPPTTELLMMAREGLLGAVSDALDRARRENTSVRNQGVRVKADGHSQEIDLEVIPFTDTASAARHFVVLFDANRRGPSGEAPLPRPAGPLTPEEESDKDQEIRRLREDLASTRTILQSVIEQKEAANEELRGANDEVICANEELQSTNEEMTTSQEELQAMNEELSTVNDELQNRIRLANQLGDDLANLIESTRIPIVVLGPDLCVRRFTPSAREIMNLRPGDVGRPLGELKAKINVPDLEQLVHEVIDTLVIQQREVVDQTGTWHKLYIRPYKTLDHKVGGAVIMLIDIDILKRREQEIQESRDYAIGIVETVREPLLVLDGELRVRTANRAFYQNFQLSPAETEGRPIYDMGDGAWNIPHLRSLLEDILPKNSHFENYEVVHFFPAIGARTLLLNAHRVVQGEGRNAQLILLAIEDITVRKQSERLRRETEDRLRAMVNGAVDAIVTIDAKGIINSVNTATERLFGYTASELIGQNVKILMPPPYRDQHDGYVALYLKTGDKRMIGTGREVLGQRRDGTTFPVDLAVSEFVDRGHQMFSGVLRDLSARKALEQEVLQAAALEQQRIGQDLHDTSAQELTALGLLAESLVTVVKQESPSAKGIALKLAEGVKRVLGQVRAFSRGLIRVDLDAQGLMAALAELAAETTDLHGVKCMFECHQPVDVADNQMAVQLYGIAREAVTNALKHAEARNIKIALESDNQFVRLRVEDDGVGMPVPAANIKGLGLRIMRYRAGLINAHLAVESKATGGAVLTCEWTKDTQHASEQDQGDQAGGQDHDR